MTELITSKLETDVSLMNSADTLEGNSMYYGAFFSDVWFLRETGHKVAFIIVNDGGLRRAFDVKIDGKSI